MYRRAVFAYLSGTGNSYRVAEWMAGETSAAGSETRVVPVERFRADRDLPEGGRSLFGLLFPTHGFTAPWLVIWFALRLPRMRGWDAFVVPTRAGTRFGPVCLPGMEGTAGWLLALILALKGCRIRGVMGLDMPSNWMALHPGLGMKSVNIITGRARVKADGFIGHILAGETRYAGFVPVILGLVLFPVSAGYLLVGRFFLSKLFFADNRCTGCGLCAANCPARAIRMWPRSRPRPYWTFSCESCMRCVAFCPERAVQAGHSWGVLLYFIAMNGALMTAFNRIAPGMISSGIINGWTGMLIEYPFILLSLAVSYAAFSLLVRIPPVNALFAWTTLTRFYRRTRDPETRLTDLRGGKDEVPPKNTPVVKY